MSFKKMGQFWASSSMYKEAGYSELEHYNAVQRERAENESGRTYSRSSATNGEPNMIMHTFLIYFLLNLFVLGPMMTFYMHSDPSVTSEIPLIGQWLLTSILLIPAGIIIPLPFIFCKFVVWVYFCIRDGTFYRFR